MALMVKQLPSPSLVALICSLYFFIVFLLLQRSNAQNATLDPSEASALSSLFQQWNATADPSWNISGEPCSGSALNVTEFNDTIISPAITCNCSYVNNTICHITQLKVHAQDRRGYIPKDLIALSYLMVLNIQKNYFTGSLPPFIGNLSALTVFEISHNGFTGTIPKELGNLKELFFLSIGSNNFAGTLPPELGNLVKLKEFYMDSCGVRGEIPSTFANFRNLEVMWAFDNALTGKIPDFIGTSWTKLKKLRFQGNSFEGPIPSSFSKLTSLESLIICDLLNVSSSSSLDFIKDLKNLTNLVLRYAFITGSIPSDIGEYQLNLLDLSFNNLTGKISPALFNMSSLNHLFLGNNSLSGILPSRKSEQLQNIDLSYNELSGSFPSWVNQRLNLSLVANNFRFDNLNISVLPGLDCLQRNFPCHRNNPRNTNFAIKCGGPQITTFDRVVYEADNSTLGAASYYIDGTRKWAVSNVGFDAQNPEYVLNLFSEFLGGYISNFQGSNPDFSGYISTHTRELFLTSRKSPGSLRYFGLGLQNGPYTVSLLFVEPAIRNRSTQTWASLGRRVFDIYIQGKLQLKDFDITKEAGGVDIAIQKDFLVSVSENYLEIHLFWAGKGTCCIPVPGYYGPSISGLKVVSGGIPSKTSKTGLIVGLTVAAGAVSFILVIAVFYVKMKQSDVDDEEELLEIGPSQNTFSYSVLRTATGDFIPENKLGEGGFGPVYKGTLPDGRIVAVKQLLVASHQGKSQFIAEIAIISAVQHRNLVKLYGWCISRTRRLLVYEYLENKSLDQALFGKNDLHLDWPTRFNICLGTARGLAYLHEESRPRIVHRDVKASNILLDAKLCPKISDFGLAKLYDDAKTHLSTRVAGTIGYLAPEYAMRGHLTEKADVFGFGVVALEILSGRPNTDNSLDTQKKYLLEWAWTLHESGRSLDLVDPRLTAFDESEAARVIGVALLCTQSSPMTRPPMSRVVAMLAGDIEVSVVTTKPSYLTDWDFKDITSSFLTDDTQTSVSSNNDSKHDNPTDPSTKVDPAPSPINLTNPMLRDIVGEGR
ncbi:hypothetical protein L1049_010442 [Liquidambar formosana]|uniref:non-specific serine/threonine protein kinase n=1 Tax=Liquidambar formosana TaxID=63359 RepID=A0AAP0R4E5_LIQFO